MQGLRGNPDGGLIQAFAPTRFVQITTSVPWVPDAADRTFSVPIDCTWQLNDTGLVAALYAGDIRGFHANSITFNQTMVIEVM